jgi:uncharacterized protein (TIGR02145 family)
MRKRKNFSSLVVILILVMVGVVATVSCERPTSADYDNPFDEKNPDFSPISSLSTIPVTQIGALQAVSGGEFSGVSGYPITQKGVCWDTNEQPDLDNNCTTEGPGATGFTSQLMDLQPDTRYFVRAYATNLQATIYGEQREFRTGNGPQFEALSPSNVQAHSVQLNGQQTGDGFTTIQEVGFCVSVFGQPESEQCLAVSAPKIVSVMDLLSGNLGSGGLAQRSNMLAKMPLGSGNTVDSKHEFTPTNQNSDNLTSPAGSSNNVVNPIPDNRGTTSVQTALSNGETQFFSLTITDLQADVRYLFRSYGMAGPVPFSSTTRDVTTRNGSITLTTLEVIDISSTTATTGGEITDDGGSPVTARGVVWGTSENPTLESNLGQTSNGTGTGSFTSNLMGLTPGATYYVRAYATNSVGTAYGAQIGFDAGTKTPSVTTTAITSIMATSAVSGGDISDDGGSSVTARGVIWSTSENPTLESNLGQTNNGTGTGSFTSSLTGLAPGATYFIRAYATNSVGTAYGTQIGFQTETMLPTVITVVTSSVTTSTAVSGGNVQSDGGSSVTARGVVWSTDENPTLESNIGQTTNGTGTGSFTSNLTGLTPGTTYYVRAYATNSVGTAYGGRATFSTTATPMLPTVTTTLASLITASSATSGGNVTSQGSATVTARGICWSATTTTPTLTNSLGCSTSGSGIGSFTANLTGLSASTQYYVRAFATNSMGTAYGTQIQFTTAAGSTTGRDTQTQVVNVTNPNTGRTWMDRNLGASRAAISSTDTQAYGDFYQWGRRADGHEKRTSATLTTLSSTDQPAHGSFILAPNSPGDWRSPQNNNLWQGVNGTNNPCPMGYRVPTEAEWNAERQSWSSQNSTGAFASPLKLPLASYRDFGSGSLLPGGTVGYYWSSSVSGTGASHLYIISSDAGQGIYTRADGYSVRCIRD